MDEKELERKVEELKKKIEEIEKAGKNFHAALDEYSKTMAEAIHRMRNLMQQLPYHADRQKWNALDDFLKTMAEANKRMRSKL